MGQFEIAIGVLASTTGRQQLMTGDPNADLQQRFIGTLRIGDAARASRRHDSATIRTGLPGQGGMDTWPQAALPADDGQS